MGCQRRWAFFHPEITSSPPLPPVQHGVSHADDLIYEWEPVFGTEWDTESHKLSGDVSIKAQETCENKRHSFWSV